MGQKLGPLGHRMSVMIFQSIFGAPGSLTKLSTKHPSCKSYLILSEMFIQFIQIQIPAELLSNNSFTSKSDGLSSSFPMFLGYVGSPFECREIHVSFQGQTISALSCSGSRLVYTSQPTVDNPHFQYLYIYIYMYNYLCTYPVLCVYIYIIEFHLYILCI